MLNLAASSSCSVSSPQSNSNSLLHPRVNPSYDSPGTHSTMGPPELLLNQENAFSLKALACLGSAFLSWCLERKRALGRERLSGDTVAGPSNALKAAHSPLFQLR